MSVLRGTPKLLLLILLPCFAFAQSFLQPKVIPTGNWPAAIYTQDINGDGFPDLIYIDQGATPAASTTHILLNDGRGNFTQSATLATAGNSLAFGNFTGSGKVDIGWFTPDIPSNTFLRSHVAANTGNGTFATPVSMLLFTVPASFQAGYTTGAHLFATGLDGFIVEDVHNNTVYAIQLYTATSLGQGSTLNLPDGPGPIAVADLNNDGKLDFVVNGLTGSGSSPLPSAQVFLNQGPPGFAPFGTTPLRFTGSAGVRSLIIQDVNLDGRPDLIAEGANGHIDVFFGNGDGTFQSTSSGGTGPLDGLTGNGGHLIDVADLNHDGLPDALTATPIGISSLLGQGTAYLGLKGIFNAGPGRTSYVTADFNHDGNLDLALDSPEGIAILFGNPDGTLQTSLAYAAGQPALSSATGVFTPSGHIDAVVSTGATQGQLFLGAGDGTFAAVPGPTSTQPGPAGLYSTVQTADINQDGRLDLIFTADGPPSALPSTGSGVSIQLGGGGGGFAGPIAVQALAVSSCTTHPAPLFGASILADVNGDGYPDLLNRDFNGYRVFESSTTTPPQIFFGDLQANPCSYNPHNLLVAADFTGDNIQDLIVESDGHLRLQRGTGGGQFLPDVGDLAVDGSLTTSGQLTAPLLLDLYGGYVGTYAGGLGFPAALGSLVAADLDRDGNQDLIATYANFSANNAAPSAANPNYIYIWYGSGSGKFLTSAKHPVNPVRLTPSRNFYQAAVADVNGDGIPDLILTDGYILSVQLGVGDGSFGPETHYLAGQGINSLSVADTRASGHTDLLLANGGAYLSNPAANRDLPQANTDVNTGGITVLLNATPNAQPPLLTPAATLTASPEPSTYGSDFFLSLVFAPPAGSPVPTGTVTFTLDGMPLGTVPVAAANNTYIDYPAPNTLPAGAHPITAVYSGDSTYAPATFTGTHTVTTTPTPHSISASPEPSVYGSAFTLTATGFGSGTYTFSIDGTTIGSVTSTTSSASIAAPATTPVGTHAISVTWLHDVSALATFANGTHVVTTNPTTLALLLCVDAPGSIFPCGTPLSATPLRNPVTMYYGQTLDGVATESSTNLTGTITFLDNATPFCTINANVSGGVSNMCPATSGNFHAGSRTVTARYSGDANNAGSTSNAIAVNVFPDTTTSTITSSLDPSTVGQAVTFTVKVAGNFATPVGTVTFFDGLTQIGTGTLDINGQASFTTSALTVGTHPIAVAYAGSSDFNPAATVLLSQVVNAAVTYPTPTIVTLVATGPTTIYFNQPADSAYSVRVADPSHPATGTITVQDNGVNVAICTNLPVFTSCPYAGGGTLTVGVHSITVLYNGDAFNGPASSPAVVFTVLPDTTTATLTSSLNPAVVGSSVTFTATLAGNGGTLGATPPGSVNFLDGATLLATVPLTSAGTASYTTSTLAVGTHPITVVYAGSTNFLAVTSAVLTQVITNAAAPPPPPAPTFTLTVTPNPVTIPVGLQGVLSVTVTTTGTFTQPIALTCSGLATQSSCNFIQPRIPAVGGTTTLYLSTAAPHNCGDPTHPYFVGANARMLTRSALGRSAALLLPVSALLLSGLRRGRRRMRRLGLMVLLCTLSTALLAGLSGCGSCTDLGTRPGHYSLTVTATPQDGSVPAVSQTLEFTVILP